MMMIMIVISVLLWPTINSTDMTVLSGDLNIGALFSIRESPDPADRSLKCGKIREVHGIQKVESALLALDYINDDPHLLPGVRLGLEVRDTCWSELIALRQSLCLVRGESIMSLPDPSRKLNNRTNEENDMILPQDKMIIKRPSVVGVIGPATGEQSISVQNLLKLLNIPQIGYSDTMEKLNDGIEYPTFLRGAPCDSFQSSVILDILAKYDWKYVASIHTKGAFGEHILESFRKLLERDNHLGVCIAADHEIEPHFHDSEIDAIILDLNNYKSINVIICFCEREMLKRLFESTKRLNLTSRFTFIASDGWGDVERTTYGVEEQAWGTIFIHIHSPDVPQFTNYYTSLKPATNTRNPWFWEFWEDKFNCTLTMDPVDCKNSNNTIQQCHKRALGKPCTGNESLAENYVQHRKIYFVMSAMTTMAVGLHNMIAETCGSNYTGLCPEVLPFDTSKLVNHLRDISFSFKNFTSFEHGKPPSRYDILNFQKLPDGTFKWIKIGHWNKYKFKLDQEYQNRKDRNSTSICSIPCPIGYHKSFTRINQNQNCCWECELCDTYEYVSPSQEKCRKCPLGERPNATRTGCDKIPVTSFQWHQPMIIMILTFTVIGLAATLLTFCIFLKYRNTPVVKASNREFSYLMLSSITLSQISVFAILVEPTRFSCAISRILPGVSLTMMYASLFTEMNRIARISKYSTSEIPTKKPRLVSISSQIAITFLCVVIEAAICFAMILVSPTAPLIDYGIREQPIITCSISAYDVVPPLMLIFFLFALCILYAFKTRNIPGNFNEAKFTGFAMIISLATWIVFATVYFGTKFKGLTMGFCLTLFPSFILIFLFFPKLYIIIRKPEKNNIGLLTTSRSMKTKIKSESTVDIVGSICEDSIHRLRGSESPLSGHCCKLRKSVAIQTNAESLRNRILSLHNDGKSLRDDDSGYTKVAAECPRSRLNPLQYETGINSHDDRSATLLCEFCLELNVGNLPQLDNNCVSILSKKTVRGLDEGNNVSRKRKNAVSLE